MKTFHFKEPFFLSSPHKTKIFDSENRLIGFVKKVYTKKTHRYISLLMDKLYFNYVFINLNGEELYFISNIIENKWDFIKSRWIFKNSIENNEILIKNATKIKTNIRFEGEYNKKNILIKRDFGDNKIHIYYDNLEISEIHFTPHKIPREVTAIIKKENVLPNEFIFFIYFIYRMYSM
ncbi:MULTISPECIES: tubby C-terminal domain-like protein [Lysinibacillus]|uniref:tubby C-terminal domain-like protein n=1 Tax=Lysinibacillus TaxID=400634 RepID=UPI0030F4DA8C